MKRFALIFTLALFLVAAAAQAQEVRRLVVLPFNTSEGAGVYGLGLATALQRSLNVIDGVYAPPVGDTFLLTERLLAEGGVTTDAVAEAFGAGTVVSGEVVASGDATTITLGLAGPEHEAVETATVEAPLSDPAGLVREVGNALVALLELPMSGTDRADFDAVTAATPSLPSLAAVSQGALRLQGSSVSDLSAAASLDGGSSWVLSEYARALAIAGEWTRAAEASLQAVQANDRDIEAWVVRGVVSQNAGEAEAAREAFDRALALNPNHPLALVGKGQLAPDVQEAAALLEQAIAIYPRLVDAYVTLAELQLEDDPQRALQTVRRGARAVPESARLHRTLINIAVAGGDAAGATAYLRDTVLAQPGAAPNLYSLAALLPDSQLSEALALVRQGRERYPESESLILAEAGLLERQDDPAAAEALLAEAYAQNPNNPEVANALAVLQARQGEVDAARETLLAVQGENATAQFNLAQLYLEAGQAGAALSTVEPLVNAMPDDAEVQLVYGLALARLGQVAEARAALERALALEPDLQIAVNALSLLEQEQEVTGGDVVELNAEAAEAFQRGKTAFEGGDYAEAVAAFEQARAAQDEGIIAFFQGLALYLDGQTRQAVSALQRAAEVYPESDIVLNNLGLAQLQLGRFDLALENLARATELNDANANAHLNLGLAHYELGRYAQAVSEWERAIALEPGLEAAISEELADARTRATP